MRYVWKMMTLGLMGACSFSVYAMNTGRELPQFSPLLKTRSSDQIVLMCSQSASDLDKSLGSQWSLKSNSGFSWFLPGVFARMDSSATIDDLALKDLFCVLINSDVVKEWLDHSSEKFMQLGISIVPMNMDEDPETAYCDMAGLKRRLLALVRFVGSLHQLGQAIVIMNHPNSGTMLGCFLLAHYSALDAVLENCENVSTIVREDFICHIVEKLRVVGEVCDAQVLEEMMSDSVFMVGILAARSPCIVALVCEEFPLLYEDVFGDYEPSPKDTGGYRCRFGMLREKVDLDFGCRGPRESSTL